MSSQWSAIPSYEVHNTRREWMDGEGRFYASVKLMVAWGDRFKLLQDLYTSSLGAGPPSPTGYAPRAYPGGAATATSGLDSPDMTSIGVMSASISSWNENYAPRDANNEVMDYKSSAFVDVQYGRRFNIEETIDFDAEVIKQTHRMFLWFSTINSNDKQIVHELEAPIYTRYDAVITRRFIGLARSDLGGAGLTPDFSTLHLCVGHTNKTEYQSIQLGNMVFKIGTLLLMEPIVTSSTDMQNFTANNTNNFSQSGFSVDLKFLYRRGVNETLQGPGGSSKASDEDTHDLFWRPRKDIAGDTDKGGWDRLLIKEESKAKTTFKFFAPYTRHPDISNTGWLVPSLYPIPAPT